MAVAGLDLLQLSSFCSVPQTTLNTLIDAPTADLVQQLLGKVLERANDFRGLQSENLRLSVESEAAVRGHESKTKVIKSQLEKSHKESATFQQKLQDQENARASIESELHTLRQSTSMSTADTTTLKSRIASLEGSSRDTLSLLDSKNTTCDEITRELEAQHQKTVGLRKQVSELEQQLQEERAKSAAAAFREENQKQLNSQLERRTEWAESELKTKAEEHTKFRKQKSQQIAQLQVQNEEESSKVRQLQNVEASLRRVVEEISEKADERSQRIQTLQEEIAQKENAFKDELESTNRLAKLRENAASTEKARAQELGEEVERLRHDYREELGRMDAELNTEHGVREAAEEKMEQLELQVEGLQNEIATLQEQERLPNTPPSGLNGLLARSPARGDLTPRPFSPSSSRLKGNLSVTQLVTDATDLRRQLNTEKRRNEQLTSTIDGLMSDMENQSPEIEDLKTEHGRLESEVADLSTLVDTMGKERDLAVKAVRKQEGQVDAKIRESEVLRQQLRDLSSQVKMLLMEAHLREQGQEELSPEGRAQLERLAHGEMDDDNQALNDTDNFISSNLVTFRSIVDLQEQNTKLLKVTREIGDRMEHEEALRKQTDAANNWDELQQKYERCKDEIKSLITQSQSYIRERDMFRQMLDHRGQLPQGSDLGSSPGQLANGGRAMTASVERDVMNSVEESPSSKDMTDYAKLLKNMQEHFDNYRTEAATDRATMKEQIDDMSRANSQLRSEAARSNGQATLAHERYEMLQANYTMLKSENAEQQKRTQAFYENAAKQDLRVQQAAEDLVEARGIIDSMRNETANLKAEKDFWKTIEKRINDDNENLIIERGRLNSLNASLQSLLNEREHSEGESRRRLQAQIDTLESDLQRTKTSLREETEEGKRSASRREYEHEQAQQRIDDLVSSHGSLREELAKATTTKDHLNRQVDELTIELRSARERLDVMQSAPAAQSADRGDRTGNDNQPQDSNLTQEQELGVRVSELQRDLDLSKNELEDAKLQVEQYKGISQASEDELNSLNETQDMYRQETEKVVQQKDARIKELEQRTQDISTELADSSAEMGDLRNQQAEHDQHMEEQRKEFETRLAQVKDEGDRHAAAAQYYQQDLKAQASIAQQAQQNYENELVKHADAAKALQKVRGEYNDVKVELVEARTEAETARSSLTQSEESWGESKDRFEREVGELRAARQDLKLQNDRLHQQLETLTTAQRRVVGGQGEASETDPTAGLDNLQEVVKYLRREKEIVDVQLELSSQEAKRLKQQLDYTQSQLDDSRLKLNQQRRTEAETQRSALDHNKLMETIHDLNTHRESNMTLRSEARQAQAALATRTQEVEELRIKMEPMQIEISDLKGEREAHEGEIRLLKENADRWQQRAQNVLQKYDRVDPAELEALKEKAQSLESERDELNAAKTALQEQLDAATAQVAQLQEQGNERLETMRARLTEQFKTRSKQQSDRIREKEATIQAAAVEKQGLEERLSGLADLQNQLDVAKAERDAAVEQASADKTPANAEDHASGEEGEVEENAGSLSNQTATQAVDSRAGAAEKATEESAAQTDVLQTELGNAKARIAELEAQITQSEDAIATLHQELSTLRNSHHQDQQPTNIAQKGLESQVNKLREDLAHAQQDAERLRTSARTEPPATNPPVTDASGGDVSKSDADQVAEQTNVKEKELEQRYEQRVNSMKAQLNKKLADFRTQYRQETATEHEKALQSLKNEHQQELERLGTQHQAELEKARQLDVQASPQKVEADQSALDDNSGLVKSESQGPGPMWSPTEQEARSFVNSNDIVKRIMRTNLINQVNKQKEALVATLKEEHEKSLAEAQEKANTAKEQAVAMEGKRTAAKMNLNTNKWKIAEFKLGIVSKAAQETPEKAIKGVWDIANAAKAPAALPQNPQGAIRPPALSTATAATSEQPTAAVQAPQSNGQGTKPAVGTFGQPTPFQPTPQAQTAQGITPTTSQPSSTIQNPFKPPPGSGIPQAQSHSTDNSTNSGSGLNALRPLQSGLPMPRGGPNRGGVRGRGSGIGRGGPGIDTSRAQGQPQGRGSPTSAGMNPGARQFVPGNKRPREDGPDGSAGGEGQGKRIRGGGGGA